MTWPPLVTFRGVSVRSLVLGVIAGMALVGSALAQEFQRPPDLTPEDRPVAPDAFMIAPDRLSSQDSRPFLFGGRPMDPHHPRWDQYQPALAKFPTVESCLSAEAQTPEGWDLLKVEWTSLLSHKDIEVCLFRIADTLGDRERVVDWLVHSGYRTWGVQQVKSDDRDARSPEMWFVINAYLDGAIFDARRQIEYRETRWLVRLLHWLTPPPPHHFDHDVGIWFDRNGAVDNVLSRRRGG